LTKETKKDTRQTELDTAEGLIQELLEQDGELGERIKNFEKVQKLRKITKQIKKDLGLDDELLEIKESGTAERTIKKIKEKRNGLR
jgi:cell fate (sporulation/competence/biofilm development) regulator YmcA (YheA/YmcA/DUF963 family)